MEQNRPSTFKQAIAISVSGLCDELLRVLNYDAGHCADIMKLLIDHINPIALNFNDMDSELIEANANMIELMSTHMLNQLYPDIGRIVDEYSPDVTVDTWEECMKANGKEEEFVDTVNTVGEATTAFYDSICEGLLEAGIVELDNQSESLNWFGRIAEFDSALKHVIIEVYLIDMSKGRQQLDELYLYC